MDVKRLKDNIWRELALAVSVLLVYRMCVTESIIQTPAEDEEPKTFTNVLSGLQKAYPKDKMDEISVSFCFICLLHLANEQSLSIKPEEADGEFAVGELTTLAIRKEASVGA